MLVKKRTKRSAVLVFTVLWIGIFFSLSLQFVFNMEQGLPLWPEWLFFNRVNTRARKGVEIGPALCLLRFDIYFFLFVLFTCEQICKVA
jgi:hypothetical protein